MQGSGPGLRSVRQFSKPLGLSLAELLRPSPLFLLGFNSLPWTTRAPVGYTCNLPHAPCALEFLMSSFAVVLVDSGVVVWQGLAESPCHACERAARDGGMAAGEFQRYDFQPPSHKEDEIDRLVLSVHALKLAPAAGASLAALSDLDEDSCVGTFMAIV